MRIDAAATQPILGGVCHQLIGIARRVRKGPGVLKKGTRGLLATLALRGRFGLIREAFLGSIEAVSVTTIPTSKRRLGSAALIGQRVQRCTS